MALIGILAGGVVARYGFNESLTWSAEAAQWLLVALVFTVLPIGVREGMREDGPHHLRVSVLRDRLGGAAGHALDALATAVTAWTLVALLSGGTVLLGAIGGTHHTLGLPAWLKFAAVLPGCALALGMLAARETTLPARARLACVALGAAVHALPRALAAYGVDVAHIEAAVRDLADPATAMLTGLALALAAGVPVVFALLFAALVAHACGALMDAGGLAQVNVLSSGMYAGVSGSSYAEAALGTRLLVPRMVREGYSPGYACALTAASATLPNVVPPSIALLILAAAANLSVSQLWLAGIGPGLLMLATLMVAVRLLARDQAHIDATLNGEIGDEFKALYAAQGFKVLDFVTYGARHVIAKAPVTRPAQVDGLKMRVIQGPLHIEL